MDRIGISQVDALFVNGGYPIEFVFYFPGGVPTGKVRDALRRLSTTFWPLFGRYRDGAIVRSSRDGENDHLLETVRDRPFDSSMDAMGLWREFRDLNPVSTGALFFLGVVQFDNGTVLVPRLSHLAGDGYSYFYFLSVLASLCQPSALPFRGPVIRWLAAPRVKRTVLRDYHFDRTDLEARPAEREGTIRLERIPRRQVQAEADKLSNESGVRVSANDLLSAMVVSAAAGRQTPVQQDFGLTIPVDVRRRVKALGPKFLGNGILLHRLIFSREELARDEPATLALKLRRAAPQISAERYRDYLAGLETEIESLPTRDLGPYDPDRGCLVTNLSRMPVQRLDFGSGPPTLVFPVTVGRNSVAVLAEGEDFLLRFVD